jgi:hypothetical protein
MRRAHDVTRFCHRYCVRVARPGCRTATVTTQRRGHHSRFVVADEGIARVMGVDPRWSVRTHFEVRSGGPRERGRDEGGDCLASPKKP